MSNKKKLQRKLAIVSDQLAGAIGGSESILFALLDLFPQTPVYTTVYNSSIIPNNYKNNEYHSTFIQHLPFSKKLYKMYFPIMPVAVEFLNLQEYDIIFSSHHSAAKGIIPRPDATHICYCHSPARYIWDMFWTYSDLNRFGYLKQIVICAISNYLRIWDVTSSNRVDYFLANSTYTAKRIKKFYNRDSEILFPPVNTEMFYFKPPEDYFLMAGRLVAYKGYELAVEAFNESGLPLVIIGDGPERNKLEAKAGKNIKFMGKVSQGDLINFFSKCKGFVFPGKEDFGIVMAEAQASGKPVIAYKAGGALDIVADNETGVLFQNQTISDLNRAVKLSDEINWDHKMISEKAKGFDVSIFKERLNEIILNSDTLKRHN